MAEILYEQQQQQQKNGKRTTINPLLFLKENHASTV
jgi:hypothetical protein